MMNPNLQFDFLVDKEKNAITVKKEFAANRQLVWDCHTKSELLDQWFAPQPFTLRTEHMNFSNGGHWLYAMVGPDGSTHYGRMDYETITPIDNYMAYDGFCDSEGNLNPNLPRAKWSANFSEMGSNTFVETLVVYDTLDALETVIKMGLKEGLSITLTQLDKLLETINK
jgi:uncharacterized protein YndB with AHSA1/START domain